MKTCLLVLLVCFSFLSNTTAKGGIYLVNPSFEDTHPMHSKTPWGWHNCGFPEESPPDIQPGSFSVTKEAKDGKTYVGLVVRDNDTWEAVAQRVSSPLEKGKQYSFSVFLARAELYLSISNRTNEQANYSTPAILRIWGGNTFCERGELLAQSKLVEHTDWEAHKFEVKPRKSNWDYILLEAFYKTPVLEPYNGNILIDNCSEIVKKQ
jgi:hypothetical protein